MLQLFDEDVDRCVRGDPSGGGPLLFLVVLCVGFIYLLCR
jgi:hypothetical protein